MVVHFPRYNGSRRDLSTADLIKKLLYYTLSHSATSREWTAGIKKWQQATPAAIKQESESLRVFVV
jgi:hypothetical protein